MEAAVPRLVAIAVTITAIQTDRQAADRISRFPASFAYQSVVKLKGS